MKPNLRTKALVFKQTGIMDLESFIHSLFSGGTVMKDIVDASHVLSPRELCFKIQSSKKKNHIACILASHGWKSCFYFKAGKSNYHFIC